MKSREDWYRQFPELRKWGLTDGEFWKNEFTNEAAAILPFVPEDSPCAGAEVGVACAKSACCLLHVRPKLHIKLVDNWAECPDAEEIARYNLSFFPAGQWEIIKSDSTAAAKRFPEHALDYVFIDASKDPEKYYADIKAWLPKIRVGGTILGHDIMNPLMGNEGRDVYNVVEKVAKEIGKDFDMCMRRHSWFIRL